MGRTSVQLAVPRRPRCAGSPLLCSTPYCSVPGRTRVSSAPRFRLQTPPEFAHMAKKMLIDAAHPEETRVVVMDGARVDDFDFETLTKQQLRGNIYLAKVTRVEPSLQAAFVEYGGNRHGFLAFSEIHPDYFQIPTADREALKAEVEAGAPSEDDEEEEDEDAAEERRRRILTRRYKIQEVVRRRQIMLVQVVKDERGNKGAALTTFLSLAGRYCVLMPNTGRGGGISRKINNAADRKRLKKVATDLAVPQGMGLIIRTAGAKRTKTEIKRDYEYLMRQWENIRDTTLRSVAPALIYEESSLVKRSIRDLYDKDVEEIHVEGEAAYREAKDFVRMLMPSHAKKVSLHKLPTPLFQSHGVERQLETIYSPVVQLKSGGYIVINPTEALVAIDVNSGRSTKERNIEATALKTNLEAAEEAARQIRLRDLAGIIVIDFIDMDERKNNAIVEKKMKDALRFDRARIQTSKISAFGLLELSRQRRRTGVLEGSSHICEHCAGTGRVRSTESSALQVLRAVDERAAKPGIDELEVRCATSVALYVLNEKRDALQAIEDNRGVRLRILAGDRMNPPEFEIHGRSARYGEPDGEIGEAPPARPPRPMRQRGPMPDTRTDAEEEALDLLAEEEEALELAEDNDGEVPRERTPRDDGEGGGRRRRRNRRGRRGTELGSDREPREGGAPQPRPVVAREDGDGLRGEERSGRRRRRRRGRGRRSGIELDSGEAMDMIATAPWSPPQAELPQPEMAAEPLPAPAEDSIDGIAPEAEPVVRTARPRRSRARSAQVATPEVEAEVTADADMPAFMPTLVSPAPEPETTAADASASPEPISEDPYEPDQARREKFFARLSRWGKNRP